MKASILGILVVVAAAGSAQAANPVAISWEPIPDDGGFITRSAFAPVFSAMATPFAAFPAASGPAGFDDYQSTYADGPEFFLQQLRFVGGVTTVGGEMLFEFSDSNGDPFSSFTVALPSAGDFVWTISFQSAPGAKDSTFLVPTNGYLALTVADNTTGRWYLGEAAPTVGTESRAAGEGTLTTHSHRFELSVPTPGAMALLGLGGLFAARRRR